MNIRLAELTERKNAIQAIIEHPGFTAILLPHLRKLAEDHAKACRNRDLTTGQRAEHIEAANMAEELLTYLPGRLAEIESMISQEKKKG